MNFWVFKAGIFLCSGRKFEALAILVLFLRYNLHLLVFFLVTLSQLTETLMMNHI